MAKKTQKRPPGVCIPWEEKRKELPTQLTREDLIKGMWEKNDALAYVYIWHCLLSF